MGVQTQDKSAVARANLQHGVLDPMDKQLMLKSLSQLNS